MGRAQDIQAHLAGEMAVPTSDTLEHDIVRISEDQVAVYNLCTDTTRHMNGIVANMHPSEGVWLFRCAWVSRIYRQLASLTGQCGKSIIYQRSSNTQATGARRGATASGACSGTTLDAARSRRARPW